MAEYSRTARDLAHRFKTGTTQSRQVKHTPSQVPALFEATIAYDRRFSESRAVGCNGQYQGTLSVQLSSLTRFNPYFIYLISLCWITILS